MEIVVILVTVSYRCLSAIQQGLFFRELAFGELFMLGD